MRSLYLIMVVRDGSGIGRHNARGTGSRYVSTSSIVISCVSLILSLFISLVFLTFNFYYCGNPHVVHICAGCISEGDDNA